MVKLIANRWQTEGGATHGCWGIQEAPHQPKKKHTCIQCQSIATQAVNKTYKEEVDIT